MRCHLYSIRKVLEYFPFKQKHFQKNVHCNIVKHTSKPHLIGAIENINTIDDYRPKKVRIIGFFYYHHSSNRRHFAIKILFLASFDPRSSMVNSVFDCSLSGVKTNFFFNRNMTEKCRSLLALVSDCFGYVFIVLIHIPDRWQSKTLMLSTNVDQIPSETDFLDCSLFA